MHGAEVKEPKAAVDPVDSAAEVDVVPGEDPVGEAIG